MHFLSYHIICTAERPGSFSWPRADTKAAVNAGAFSATRHACGDAEGTAYPSDLGALELHWVKQLEGFEGQLIYEAPHISLVPGPGFFCAVSPVLVCKHPVRTVGLGDVISSSALVRQLILVRSPDQ
jgi:ADP-dependent phosphofructokinase/glucokinase